MKSARSNILGWILVPVILSMVATYLLSSALLRNNLAAEIDERLDQEAQELYLLAERAIDPVSGAPYSSARDILELYIRRSVPDNLETIFVLVDGAVLERSSGLDLPRLDREVEFIDYVNTLNQPQVGDFISDSGAVRYIAIPVSGDTDKGHLVAAIFSDRELEKVNSTLTQLALLMLLAFATATAAGWFVAGRILRPLRQLGQITREVTDGSVKERLTGFNPNQEIGGIAADFNSMLDRTESAFASQRRFVDDAGHELKTPLTIVRGHLDLIKVDPSETSASIAIIEDEVLRMTRIVKDLQTLTSSSQASFVSTAMLDPGEIVDEVFVKTSALANRAWGVKIDTTPTLPIDRQRMVQALLQLVDNAIKATGEKEAVVIGSREVSGTVELYVGDSGKGIPEESRAFVLERFARGSWTSEDSEGSGLGLAIVDAIARGHGGQVFIGTSPLGGAEVGIRINIESLTKDKPVV